MDKWWNSKTPIEKWGVSCWVMMPILAVLPIVICGDYCAASALPAIWMMGSLLAMGFYDLWNNPG